MAGCVLNTSLIQSLLITRMTTLRREQVFKNQAYAKNSAVVTGAQIRKYLEFVNLYCEDRAPFPCANEQVALCATWLARSMKYSSVINYLSGLNYFFKLNGQPVIDYGEFVLSATLKGIRREKGDAPRRAAPLLPSMLRRIFRELIGYGVCGLEGDNSL